MNEFPSWIQAIAETTLAVVTSVTIIILWRYATDTKAIAKNSSEQVENSQMPFVALVMKTEPGRQSDWAIKNQGCGPAINLYYTRYLSDKPPMMQWMTPLAPGEEYSLPRETGGLLTGDGFTVKYESLSGKKYRTFVKRTNGEMKTTFDRGEVRHGA